MSQERDVNILLGLDSTIPESSKGIVPLCLEQAYLRAAAVEGLRRSGSVDQLTVGALLRALAADEEEDVRELAVTAISDVCGDSLVGRAALIMACSDSDQRVLLTVLEEANYKFDLEFAKSIAARLADSRYEAVRQYAREVLERSG